MAIPSEPTVSSIVAEALKRAGRTSPSAAQISDTTEHQFREVKSDITQRSSRHQLLETSYVTPVFHGISRYTWPTDADEIRSLILITSDQTAYWQAAATGGGSGSITLSASFDQDPTIVQGKFIFIHAGTGAGQVSQITSYDNTSKVASTYPAWATSPVSALSLYTIGLHHRKLYSFEKPGGFDLLTNPFSLSTPTRAAMVGREAWFDYAPNVSASNVYVLWWQYWANLDRIDEAGSVFIRHLRDHRSLWVQGVAVKVMQRYDEDRYQLELQVYQNMLDAYAGYSAGVGQVNFTDVA